MTVEVLDGPIGGMTFAARANALAQSERDLYRSILEQFVEGAPPPHAPATGDAAGLIEADLIQTDDNDRVAVAYPFSSGPTRFRVTMNDGRFYYAMCAFDALGIPYMLNERAEVQALEPDSGRVVGVSVVPGAEPTWTPSEAVAVAAFADGCSLAQSVCPHINLFASQHAATGYLDAATAHGNVLSIFDATAAGRWLFGDLLSSLGVR
ncbi:MAG: organomercurial lyase [Solirubrobacterales bacterium]